MRSKELYDKFLKKKLDNLKDEMDRIEMKIDRFNDTTLLFEEKQVLRDTFSEVTTHLEGILSDLSQDRVAIISSQEDEDYQKNGKEAGESGKAVNR